nr:putative ribonuclease H-like domain-containing protein [Tanacetum cinerariifolium]
MILNTLDNIGKFEPKGDEGYFIRYSMSSKAFRVFNKRNRRVEENLHVEFLENKAIEKGAGPNWLFDIDSLTKSMNYVSVDEGINSTNFSGTKDPANQEVKKDVSSLRYIALPNWAHDTLLESSSSKPHDKSSTKVPEGSGNLNSTVSSSNPSADQIETLTVESPIPTISSPVLTACLNDSPEPSSNARLISKKVANQEETPSLDNILSLTNRFEDILRVTASSDEAIGVEVDVSNMETTISASPTPTLRIHKDHPKRVRPIGTKWVLKNKKDERGIIVRNKARLVAQGQTQEEGIDYDEVFAPVARIMAIRLFLAYASFMGFTVYQMDAKSAFLYSTIDEEPLGFQDPVFPAKVYKVEKAMYGLHLAPRAWYGTLSKYLLKNSFQRGTIDQTLFIRRQREDFILVQVYMDEIIFGSSNPQLCKEFEALMHKKFQMSAMGELNFFLGLQVLQKEDGIFLSHDKYIGDILKKFRYSDVRSSNTLMDKENPWRKDETGKDVDLHLYRSMIGSLMYLTASRPDIMFAVCACARHQVTPKEPDIMFDVCACARHQVTPKECQLHAINRIFRYLKGHPKLGLWYPKASPFNLVAFSDSDYGGASQDRKSTTRGSHFLGRRLISWQCKKQTIVATSTTEAEYVAAASCYGQVLWIQNQLLDYGNIATAVVCLATNRVYYFSKMIFDGKGLANPIEPHHTPSPQEHQSPQSDYSPQHDSPPLSHQTIIPEPIPYDLQAPTETLTPRRLTKRAIQIAQSKALSPDADEPASLSRDDRHGEVFPTISSLDVGHDRENIVKTFAMSHESSPMVPSLDADEGSMQQRLHELMELCTSLQRVKSLEDKERRHEEPIQDDAPIIEGIIDIGEELGVDKSTEKGSNDTKEMVNVLSSTEAANILSSRGVAFSTASVSPAD